MSGVEVLAGLRARHERSPQPSSKMLVATIDAVDETIALSGHERSVVACFGACMSALERADARESPESVAALCTLLSTAMQHLPGQLLRAKFTTISAILLRTHQAFVASGHSAGQRAALPCLVLTLRKVDPSTTWAPVTGPFAALLKATMDGSPKVRKVAVNGLAEVLASVRGTAAVQPASADLAAVCKVVLSAPKLAAKAAAEATKSARPAAEAAIMRAVQDCLHFLGALKPVMPVLAEAAALDVAEQLLSLFLLAQPLLSQHAAECLLGLAQGAPNTNNVSASRLQLLLKAALPLLASQREADTQIRLVAFVEAACTALARLHPPSAAQALPYAVDRLQQLLASPSDGVRRAASEALLAVIRGCISPELVRSANVDAKGGPLARSVAALASTLQPSCSAVWHLALPIVGEMLRALGPDGAELAKLLIEPLATLCRGSADAEEATSLAHSALGAAISTQGPAAVLEVVPLDLSDLVTCDLWLVPLLRKHTSGASLAFWGEYLLPRARHVGSIAMRIAQTGMQKEQVLKLKALELQLWSCLASFASWAPDVPAGFAAFGDSMLAAFQKRDDLQAPICNALARICTQTASVLRGDAAEASGTDAGEAAPTAPSFYSTDTARANLACLGERSAQWMPQLLERFAASAPEERGQLGETITAFATVLGVEHAAPHFKACLGKLVQSLQRLQAPDQSAAVNAEADFCTALELALSLAPGVPDAAMEPLFKATTLALALAHPAAQKKAYKALAYIAEHRPAVLRVRFADICSVLLDSKAVQAAARRHRLACLTPIVTLLMGPQPPDLAGVELPAAAAGESAAHTVVSALITELVLCTKEVNAKTRSEAYDVLVRLARAMHAAQPPEHTMDADDAPTDLRNGGLQLLFAMVLAGLGSTTPRMVSAAVMALARLTFEFASELQLIVSRLLPAVCTLLHKKAREVVKSVLGFLKVAAMRVPAELLAPHLRVIVEGVLVWAEDSKNRYKLKVRHLVERLCKRCGYEAVAAVWPESEAKLLTAIRKDFARKARRKAGRAGEGSDDGAGADARSRVTLARTARASEWGHSAVFSDDDDGAATAAGATGAARSVGGKTATTRRGAATMRTGTTARGRGAAAQLAEDPDAPVDLLDMATSRALARSAAGVPDEEPAVDDFARDALGKMVISEEQEPADKGPQRRRGKEEEDVFATPWRKRRRPAAGDSDDSDGGGEAGVFGMKRALQQTEGAASLKHASKYAHSQQTARTRRTAATSAARGSRADSAAKFKAKSAAGDVKGASKVDPYSYWKLDRNLLNPRSKKKREAASKLGGAVGSGAPARGGKARKKPRAGPDI